MPVTRFVSASGAGGVVRGGTWSTAPSDTATIADDPDVRALRGPDVSFGKILGDNTQRSALIPGDTTSTETISIGGSRNASIDLRPATLLKQASGGLT